MGLSDDNVEQPKFDREKAVEIFKFVENEKIQAMKKMSSNPMQPGQDMEATMNMLVEHAKVGDMIFEKFEIEEEEFTKAVQYY